MTGDTVTLTCSVTLPSGVTGTPVFQWEGPGVTPTPADPTTSEGMVSSELTLSEISTSQAGLYTCTATLSGSINTSTIITVQSRLTIHIMRKFSLCTVPQPTVVITRSRSGIVYAGTEFTLTASITFTDDDVRAVDVDLTLDISWTRGSDVIISDTRITVSGVSGSDTSYTASLTFSPITTDDTGSYTASVTVRPMTLSQYIQTVTVTDTKMVTVMGM